MPPTLVLTSARTVRMRIARSDMSPAGSRARPASACVMVWRLKPSWREASAAMACIAARCVGGMSAGGGDRGGELRQRSRGVAERELFEGREIAALRSQAGRVGCGRECAQCQQDAETLPESPGVRVDHGA